MGSSFFAGTETALISLVRRKSREKGIPAKVSNWLEKPEDIISVTLVGVNICIILGSSIATKLFVRGFGTAGEAYSIITMSVILLIFCEILPKSAALSHSEMFAEKTVVPLNISAIVLKPLSKAASALSGLLVKFIHLFLRPPEQANFEDFESVAESGALDVGESKEAMIRRLFDVADMRAFDLMTPKLALQTVKLGKSPEGGGLVAIEDEEGEIIGLHRPNGDGETAFFPENLPLLRLFAVMFESRIDSALIVNEHGEVTGAVERRRIARFLSGIPEAGDVRVLRGGDVFVVNGAMEMTALEELLGEDFPRGQFKTVGGFIEEHLHKIPHQGYRFRWESYLFTVEQSTDRKIGRIRIERAED